MILYLVNTEYLRVDLASLHLLLRPPLGFFFFFCSMTNFIMWNALCSSLRTVLNSGHRVLNVDSVNRRADYGLLLSFK